MNRTSELKAVLINDIVLISGIAWITLFLLEQTKPGFVSSNLDLNLLLLIFVASLAAAAGMTKPVSMNSSQRGYCVLFLIVDAALLARLISLQFSSLLLGLVIGFCFFSLLIYIVFINLYDRGSRR